MKNTFIKATLLLAVVSFLLSSCSGPESVAKKAVADQTIKLSGSRLELVTFNKKNGVENNLGVETYRISYTAQLKASKHCWVYITDGVLERPQAYDQASQWNTNTELQVGDKIWTRGIITLLKTDNGWQPQ